MLPFSYVLESPRLLYLSSVGAAIFWAAPLAGQWTKPTMQRIFVLLSSLALIVTLVWDGVYLQRRAVLYTQLGQAIQQLHSSSITPECAAQSAAPTLLINFPSWYFAPKAEYLIGHDGITTLSEGQSLDELFRINFGVTRTFSTATLPDIMPANVSFVGLGNARAMDDLLPLLQESGTTYVYQSTAAGMRLRSVGCYASKSNATHLTQATIGQQVSLVSSNINTNAQRNELVVTLEWQLLKPMTEDVTVFAQALDASGKLIAQSDGYPLGGTSPMRLWQASERWFDTRYITLPDAALLNTARVVVGIYSTGSGQRLIAVDSAGQRLPDDAVEVHR